MFKLLFVVLLSVANLFGIENYEVFVRSFTQDHELYITLRRFVKEEKTYYLIANTNTLKTSVKPLESPNLSALNNHFWNTPYGKLLLAATQKEKEGGIGKASILKPKTLFLTMDMCPSKKVGYEEDFIETLTALNGKTSIAIAMSSAWIYTHEKAFAKIANNPLLDITWVNHSHTHFYDSTLANKHNFMLHPDTDVAKEILGLEQTLIERGALPSIFFRFPGLISDKSLMRTLRETYFLVPIGSHTWIAKHEPIREGSIVLIHGNKNEHYGIELLEKKLPSLVQTYRFKPLREAFIP